MKDNAKKREMIKEDEIPDEKPSLLRGALRTSARATMSKVATKEAVTKAGQSEKDGGALKPTSKL